jgi:hypothetical protein
MNEKLKELCLQNSIPFFNTYNLLQDNNIISSNVVDGDKTHLDRKNIKLREQIETQLKELILISYKITY